MKVGGESEEIVIFSGSGLNSGKIAEEISRILKIPHPKLEIKKFPDGEPYVRVPVDDVKGKHVLYVQSTAPEKGLPQSDSLMELFFTLDALKEKGAKKVDVIATYLAHARQDKEFQEGEIVSTRTLARILKSLGINQLYTIDIHSHYAHRLPGDFQFEEVKAYNIMAARALANYIKKNLGIMSPILIIPDKGHAPIADTIEDILLPEEVVFLLKERESARKIAKVSQRTVKGKETSFNGKDVVIFDDMVSTGTTITKACQFARKRGARKIVVAATHTLYLEDARNRILEAGVDRIIATDTIPKSDSVVPIAPIIAESLKENLYL